jgi:hypothetical protein
LIASVTIDARAFTGAGLAGPQPDPGQHRRGVAGADRGRQRRQTPAQHLPSGDLGMPEAGALLGVAVDRAQQRVDVDQRPLLDPRQQTTLAHQTDQVRPRDRGQLAGVAVGELPQKLTQRRRRVDLPEQPRHPTGADHVQIIDTVRARGHPGDDRGQLARRVHRGRGHPRRVQTVQRDPLVDQLRQPGLLGQRHHRDQASTRHEVLIIEHRRPPRPRIR